MRESQIARSPITNRWGEAPLRPVPHEEFIVYRGSEGHAYSHHPQLTSLDGRLVASWSHGIRNEDDPGQVMLYACSDDAGVTWSEPRTMLPRRPGRYADVVFTGMGLRRHGGRLIAYLGVYEYNDVCLRAGVERPGGGKAAIPVGEQWTLDTHTEVAVSEDDGETWGEPVRAIERFIPNMPPAAVASGRLIMSGNLRYPYTDDAGGVSGWRDAVLPRLPEGYVDDPEGFHKGCRHRGDPHGYCEGSFFQTDDGVIHMMLRIADREAGRLAVTESRDDGITWSEPAVTGYTDACSRFQFGRLPDGRFFGLSCPQPRSRRTPMILATSDDGVVFDRHYLLGGEESAGSRLPGHHKGGRYGYPVLHLEGDSAYAILSIEKEDVAVCRFRLRDLT